MCGVVWCCVGSCRSFGGCCVGGGGSCVGSCSGSESSFGGINCGRDIEVVIKQSCYISN